MHFLVTGKQECKRSSYQLSLILLSIIGSAGCVTLDPIEMDANTYNIQFLTPSWWSDTSEISGDHWPNTAERASEIAEFGIRCLDFSLLQETVNNARRREILNKINTDCGGSYSFITLQHDWDVIDHVVDGPDYAKALVALAIDELESAILPEGATPEELAELILDDGGSFWNATNPLSAVGEPTPFIHNEIGIITNNVVTKINQHEFSQASGIDRFAAKGILHVGIHLTTRRNPPEMRPLPMETGPVLPPTCTGGVTVDCDEPPVIPPEGPDEPDAGGVTLDVFVTHLNADSRPHASQIAEVVNFVDAHWAGDTPIVLAGDFNIDLTEARFQTLCLGIQALTPGGVPSTVCDGLSAPTVDDVFHARVGATNQGGWSRSLRAPTATGGRQIDHVFVHGFKQIPTFSRRFNPVRGFGPRMPVGLIARGVQTLSDHAEIELTGGEVSPTKYPDRAPISVARTVKVELHAIHAGIEDGCDAPDPKGSATLRVNGATQSISFGPSDDRATLGVNKTLELPALAGVLTGQLIIDLAEHDALFCGKDDELDINPSPTETNAEIDLDFTWDGGISLNSQGLGWYGQPTVLNANPNWASFTVTVAPL